MALALLALSALATGVAAAGPAAGSAANQPTGVAQPTAVAGPAGPVEQADVAGVNPGHPAIGPPTPPTAVVREEDNRSVASEPPVARLFVFWGGLVVNRTYVLPGETVRFDANDSSDPDGEVVRYDFDLDGDGDYELANRSDPVVERSYRTEGFRTVELRVTDDAGDTNTTRETLFVDDPPVARFDYAPDPPTVGETVTFDGRNSSDYNGSITDYRWLVNGSRVGTGPTLDRTFDAPGLYNVTLVVEDDEDGGPSNRTSRDVLVENRSAPTAAFRIDPRPAVAGEETTLDASGSSDSDGSIVEYRWDFDGDGAVDQNVTAPTVTHRFDYNATGEGYAVVELVVVDDDGQTARATLDLSIVRAPTARCTVVPDTVAVGETATIDASNSTNAESYQYDTDGDPAYETDLVGAATRNVSLEEAGNYTLGVRVFDESGNRTDEADCPVTVTDAGPPRAAFDAPDPATLNRPATLDASNSTDDGSIVEYRWDLDGDGTTDRTTAVPTLNYTYRPADVRGGFANTALEVVDDEGRTDRTSRDVRVVARPVVACTVDPRRIAPNGSVTVSVNATNADAFEYDFDGDGEFDTDLIGDRTVDSGDYDETFFPGPGEYVPRVRATNFSSERRTVVDCPAVTVREGNDPPGANFTIDPRPAVAGEATTLDASNSTDPDGSVVEYRWDFDGDGTVDRTATTPVVTHRFDYDATGQGYAVVELVVVDDDDATGRASSDLEVVRPDLAPSCSVSPRQIAPGGNVTVAVNGSRVDAVEYDFDGDGEFDTDLIGTAASTADYDRTFFPGPGEYVPRVRVTNFSTEDRVVIDCPPVTVERENVPPNASLTVQPGSPTVGQSVTLDASGSSDSDGSIAEYRWDVDGDGAVDRTTTDPTTTASFVDPGSPTVSVVVVDDDGATDGAERVVEVRAYEPECVVSNRTVSPGESVSLRIANPREGFDYGFDRGDGDVRRTDGPETTVSYDEPGTYRPRAVAYVSADRTVAVDCPAVEVANAPPEATVSHSPSGPDDPTPGETVTFDASGSSDPDGSVVEYRWDFDGDGTVDRTTTDPTVTHTYDDAGDRSVRLVVVDDAGATAEATDEVSVATTGGGGLPIPLPWLVAAALLVVAGLLALRLLPVVFGGGESSPAYAVGRFETPADGGTVVVDDVGFRPDLIALTAVDRPDDAGDPAASAAGGDAAPDGGRRPGGAISLGAVTPVGDADGGRPDQQVVAVADDGDRAVGTTGTDRAIALTLPGTDSTADGDDRSTGRTLSGRVDRTTDDGFVVGFDDLPASAEVGGHPVRYAAFDLGGADRVEVGQFRTPASAETGAQTVDLGVDADYVELTACTLGGADETTAADAVGLSHGRAVPIDRSADGSTGEGSPAGTRSDGRGSTLQHAVGGAVRGAPAGTHDDRAIHLPATDGDDPVVARATAVGDSLELAYDRTGDRRVVTYVAVDADEVGRPSLGSVRDDGRESARVDLGFDPGLVSVLAAGWGSGGDRPGASGGIDLSVGAAVPDGDRPEEATVPPAGRGSERGPGGDGDGDPGAFDGHVSSFVPGGFELSPGRSAAARGDRDVRADGDGDGGGRRSERADGRSGSGTTTDEAAADRSTDDPADRESEEGRREPGPLLYAAWPVPGDAGRRAEPADDRADRTE